MFLYSDGSRSRCSRSRCFSCGSRCVQVWFYMYVSTRMCFLFASAACGSWKQTETHYCCDTEGRRRSAAAAASLCWGNGDQPTRVKSKGCCLHPILESEAPPAQHQFELFLLLCLCLSGVSTRPPPSDEQMKRSSCRRPVHLTEREQCCGPSCSVVNQYVFTGSVNQPTDQPIDR